MVGMMIVEGLVGLHFGSSYMRNITTVIKIIRDTPQSMQIKNISIFQFT